MYLSKLEGVDFSMTSLLMRPLMLCVVALPCSVALTPRLLPCSVALSPRLPRHRVLQMTTAVVDEKPLLDLIEERQLRLFAERAFAEPSAVVELLQNAGFAGIVAYLVAAASFYSLAVPIGELVYHTTSGQWLDPRVLLQEDTSIQKAETLALLAGFYLACTPFAPVRLGGALLLTPNIKRSIEANPALTAFFEQLGRVWDATAGQLLAFVAAPFEGLRTDEDWAAARRGLIGLYPAFVRRAALKVELLELATKCRGGIVPLEVSEQARLDELVTSELPALNPTPEPARSALFSGEWECRWTTEKELNFAVDKGLFGLPWTRTYQKIDVGGGTLTNVIAFDGGALTVGSSIEPDPEGDGSRFNFAFEACSVRWRGVEVPLPPVGRGWGELLYLDEEMRIQRDVRGDLLVATRVATE